MFKEIPPPFKHQAAATAVASTLEWVYDASDPGTGKTRTFIDVITNLLLNGFRKTLVLAPKSILVPAWANDIKQFAPHLTYTVATATNRKKAFDMNVNVYITNHDAVKWIQDNVDLGEFDILIIDEITAFKHRTSQRSKALAKIVKNFRFRAGLSGTPNSNGICDIWHQIYVLDDGENLGTSFWKFRQSVCEPKQIGPRPEMLEWVDKEGAEEAVMDILSANMIRNKLEDCHDMPEQSVIRYNFKLTPKHKQAYDDLQAQSVLLLEDGDTVTALHAGTLTNKLLQLASGAVYDQDKVAKLIATERYELVIELIKEYGKCLVAFNWTHQRDQMVDLAKKAKLKYAIIDGSVKDQDRIKAVEDFQAGKLDAIFAHYMSASHGLTLTTGQTTIWPSPIHDAERYRQFNGRQYRAGQKEKTRVIQICAEDTAEGRVYDDVLSGKLNKMQLLLDLAQELQAA